jgi:hypothetical protein
MNLPARLLFILACATPAVAQGVPIPRGIRQADQTEEQTQRNIPPPMTRRTQVDLTKLHQEADQLAKTAQTIPADISVIEKGLLPKDLTEKLKEIEKLSKELRKQLSE